MCECRSTNYRGSEATLLERTKTGKNGTFRSSFTPSRVGQKEILRPSDQVTSPGVTQMHLTPN